jgi:hypothetical protein
LARYAYTDYLQPFAFWLFDLAPIELVGLPIFNPLLGFTSISAPDINGEDFPIYEGNWFFQRSVIRRAAVPSIALRRGATFSDSDFYRWMISGLTGNIAITTGYTYRRDLMLVHFFARNPIPLGASAQVAVSDALANQTYGPFEFAARVPAKAYMLHDCTPLSWKSGNDFDAQDGSVSIAEVVINCEMVEEISLSGSISGAVGALASTAVSAASAILG